VRTPTPHRLWRYLCERLALRGYLQAPGDGRVRPQIGAAVLLWAQLLGQVLREGSYHALEALVRSPARRALRIERGFGDDALGYFTERLAPGPTRAALAATVRRAKRNKAFGASGWVGVAIDGTGAGHCQTVGCALCHPIVDAGGQRNGALHHFELISVVGTGVTLPFDVEPYGPGDCEYIAGQRLLRRAITEVGPRFADYVVVDGEFATAPFLHVAGDLGLRVVARLKGNLPELYGAAQARFTAQPPDRTVTEAGARVELWDADDFDPWTTLRWGTVRVLRYRQHKPDGTIVEAYWLTDFPRQRVSSQLLYRFAKSRWEIENAGFNDGKTRHGMEHISHHHPNSLLIGWLVTILALTIERLYRLRYLHRGQHRVLSAIDLVRLLRLSLGRGPATDTS
jgi:DDE family transposase